MARALPSHSIVAVSEQCYDDLMEDDQDEEPYAVAALMTVISENVSGLNKSQVCTSKYTGRHIKSDTKNRSIFFDHKTVIKMPVDIINGC